MITIQDLIKYGLARDVGPVREQILTQRNTSYEEQLAKLERDLNRRVGQAEAAGNDRKKITSLEREYNASVKKLESDRTKALSSLEQRFNAEQEMYERRLEDPRVIRQISEFRTAEHQQELQRIKTESEGVQRKVEGVQREAAERQAGRLRARGGRGARQMLSTARLSPESMGVGGQSTLGAAPF
jgi:chromosome segregation ATPase